MDRRKFLQMTAFSALTSHALTPFAIGGGSRCCRRRACCSPHPCCRYLKSVEIRAPGTVDKSRAWVRWNLGPVSVGDCYLLKGSYIEFLDSGHLTIRLQTFTNETGGVFDPHDIWHHMVQFPRRERREYLSSTRNALVRAPGR